MDFLIALTPILIVIIGVVVLDKPAKWVSFLAAIYTILLSHFYYGVGVPDIWAQTKSGLGDGVKMVYMIFAAFLILNMLIHTGAMDKIKEIIAEFTTDRRKQVVIIAFCFGGFLEGVAGAGTPAAICAPFLMALGIPALQAASSALIFNGVAASLGAAGLTTFGGFSPFLSNPGAGAVEAVASNGIPHVGPAVATAFDVNATILNVSMATACIQFFGALITPLLVIGLLFGRKALDREYVRFGLIVGLAYGLSLVLVGAFVGAEFPTITAGVVSLIVAIVYIRVFNKDFEPTGAYKYQPDLNSLKSDVGPVQALSTYMILLVLLPAVRFIFPEDFLRAIGFGTWIGTTIFVVCIIGSFILGSTRSMPQYIKTSFFSILPALMSMCSLLVLSNLMNTAGMLGILGTGLAHMAGKLYPAIAVIIGSLGSFVAGTTTGSNIMFAPMHFQVAHILSLSVPVLFAAQCAGGALGNMICTNNVVAVCATVDMKNQEGIVMKKVLLPITVLWIVYGALALLYAYVLMPNLPIVLQ